MAKNRSGAQGKPKNPSSRGVLPPKGETVVSEGKSYRRFNVGDRLESRSARNPKPSTVTAADYADYLNSFSGSRPISTGSVAKRTGTSRTGSKGFGFKNNRGRRGNSGFDPYVPGSQIKDVVRRQLPRLRVRLTASVVSAIIAGLLVYHIYMGIYVEYKTEVVTISPYLETIDVEGFAIRDEQVLSGSLSSTSVMTVQNGDKVSAGEPIINTFSSEAEAEAYERASEIDRELERLRSMITAPEDSANAVTLIGKQLDNKMVALNNAAVRRDMSETVKLKSEISYLINKRMVAMHQADDFDERVELLEKEREELQTQYSKEPRTVTASSSGYFSDSCDGYESLLNASMVKELTLDRLNEIMEKEVVPPEKVIGKLVNSFNWYLACPVPAIDSDYLISGLVYTLYLPYSDNESIEAVLDRIDKQDGKDTFLAVFRCSSLASELSTVRRQPVKIEKCRYEGFAIPKSALHAGVRNVTIKNQHSEEDFPKGHLVYVARTTYPSVYALVAGQIREKEVSIIYGTDKAVICTPKYSGDYLSLGDTVVITERGLYDGKLVR